MVIYLDRDRELMNKRITSINSVKHSTNHNRDNIILYPYIR